MSDHCTVQLNANIIAIFLFQEITIAKQEVNHLSMPSANNSIAETTMVFTVYSV